MALLAGRTLLLADDSITIQKIVALTFADEGIQVIAVSDGVEAIEKLEQTSPDIVLADVFMPRMTGYQVCQHIKQTERLKNIPVMLLVGSFEPFDEAEARRVGADDILTKPFQSIRNLVDKVGALLGRQSAAEPLEEISYNSPDGTANESGAAIEATPSEPVGEAAPAASEPGADTRELPPPVLVQPPEEPMSIEELAITTADTQRLSPEIRQRAEQSMSTEVPVFETVLEVETMHTDFDNQVSHQAAEDLGDTLLDLGYFQPAGFLSADDLILDVDFDSPAPEMFSSPSVNVQTAAVVETAVEDPAFVLSYVADEVDSPKPAAEIVANETLTSEPDFDEPADTQDEAAPYVASSDLIAEAVPAAEETQPLKIVQPELVSEPPPAVYGGESGVSAPAGLIKLEQLSPEVVDAIARRAVEQLTERAVQEIAWEVVPQLAELMIKRRLEEQESQNK